MPGLVGSSLDHYQLLEQVGQGGMAAVYRAVDTRSGASVAVKVLSPTISGDRRFVRRFRREGTLVSRLKHPHIVPVIDYGEHLGMIYLVMPYIEGDTLHDRLERGRPTEAQVSRWVEQIISALAFAHTHGVLHRDVKPSNVIIDPEGNAHLTDFGLARMIEGTNTLTGSALLGTPAYMSPEQARGESLDERSDQYSLGVVLYEMSTGRLPFEADTPMATALMHLQSQVPSPRAENPRISPAVEKVILTALAKDREDRFSSIASLNQAYRAALKGDPLDWLEPVTAPITRVPDAYASGGFRSWLPAAALFTALLLGAAVYSPALGQWARSALLNSRPGVEGAGPDQASTASAVARPVETTLAPTSPVEPTAVPTIVSNACPGISLFGFTQTGNDARWNVLNATPAEVQMVGLRPTYPAGNAPAEILLGGQSVWQAAMEATPEPDASYLIDESATRVASGQVKEILIRYTWPPTELRYSLEVTFDVGCSLSARW